jgi:hypothetical protein
MIMPPVAARGKAIIMPPVAARGKETALLTRRRAARLDGKLSSSICDQAVLFQ